jgi:hypothetical protein
VPVSGQHLNIEWSSTTKKLEDTSFFISMDKAFKTFKWILMTIVPVIGGMIYLACFTPNGWRIQDFTCIAPLANKSARMSHCRSYQAVFWFGVEGSYIGEKTRVMGGL